MILVNRVAEVLAICRPPEPCPIERKRKLVVHRIQFDVVPRIPDAELDAGELARAFAPGGITEGVGSSGRMPYQLLVRPSGGVEQLLPLACVGAHARGANTDGIGIAVVGQNTPCSPEAWAALVELCQLLLPLGTIGLEIFGHHAPTNDGLHLPAGSSADPGKLCPEPVVSIAALRAAMVLWSTEDPYLALRAAGVVITLDPSA